MSIEATNRVWKQSRQQGTKLVLLLSLADMTNERDQFCWPSLETLMTRARLAHRRNVIRAVGELEQAGELWVERSRGRKQTNLYVVTVGVKAADLAQILTDRFGYLPEDAMMRAAEFLRENLTDSGKNVADEPHLPNVVVESENVAPERKNVADQPQKRGPTTTRTQRNHKRIPITEGAHTRVTDRQAPPSGFSTGDCRFLEKRVKHHVQGKVSSPPVSAAPPSYFDRAKLGADGFVTPGQGVTPVEIFYEFFDRQLSTAQMKHLTTLITDSARWRTTCQEVALRSKTSRGYSLVNVIDIYERGFRENCKKERSVQGEQQTTTSSLYARYSIPDEGRAYTPGVLARYAF